MKLDEKGYNLICSFEGLKLTPYLCSANMATIGYGNTYYPSGKKVNMTDRPITKEYALEIFKDVANRFAGKVDLLVTKELTQNQFNALVSFTYNVGTGNFASSTLLKKVNINPNDLTIKLEFSKWNKANKKVIDGLTNRRKKEAELYFTQNV